MEERYCIFLESYLFLLISVFIIKKRSSKSKYWISKNCEGPGVARKKRILKKKFKFVMPTTIENRIYIEEFTGKKCITAILLYCFHTAGVLHIFMLYNLLGPGILFYRKSKTIVKRKPNYEIGWFHN